MAGNTRWVRLIVPGITVPGNETRVLAIQAMGSGGLSLRNATLVRTMGLIRGFNAASAGVAHGTVFQLFTEVGIPALSDAPTYDFNSRPDASYSLLQPWVCGPLLKGLDAASAEWLQYDPSSTSVVDLESKAQRRLLGTAELNYSLVCSNESVETVTWYGTLSLLFHLS